MELDFAIYFLKENSRIYDKSDLITFLTANQNVTAPENTQVNGNRVYLYHHKILGFEAKFIFSEKSVIPQLNRLESRYYDVNFYIKFNVLLTNSAVDMLLNMIQDICTKFNFKIYIESFRYKVKSFNRSEVMDTFRIWKKSFSQQFPEEISKYYRIDHSAMDKVYKYLTTMRRLEVTLDSDRVQLSEYIFLRRESSRSAYVAIRWDGESEFILPPAVDILILDDGKQVLYLPMQQVEKLADKMFRPIDGKGLIKQIDPKFTGKLHKLLIKTKFPPSNSDLKSLSFEKILDI